jgi:hypothetical protein
MQTLILTFSVLTLIFSLEGLAAQTITIDEGTFLIEIEGQLIGTESFKIRSVGSGAEMRTIAQGDLVISKHETTETVQSALGALGTNMSVQAYQTRSSPSDVEINLQRRGNRFLAMTSTSSHLEERQYKLLSDRTPTIILDEYFAHHYFLVLPHQFTESQELSAVFPLLGEQVSAKLELGSVEPISLGDKPIQAQYLQLNMDGAVHKIWIDGQNRILRVEIPQNDYVAYRNPAPIPQH